MLSIDAATGRHHGFDARRQREEVRRAIKRSSFATLATSSAANRPHVAGILYVEVDGELYVNTLDSSVKVRNIRENRRVALCIPVRRFPVGPPLTVQFQGSAQVLATDDPHITRLLADGRLKPITSHCELDLAGSCFIQMTPRGSLSSYGIGVPLLSVIRRPLAAGRSAAPR